MAIFYMPINLADLVPRLLCLSRASVWPCQ